MKRIQDSVKNMVQLLDDILTINRAETGKLEFNPKLINLPQFCRQFVEEMQLSAGNKHTLAFCCSEEIKSSCLDEKLLRLYCLFHGDIAVRIYVKTFMCPKATLFGYKYPFTLKEKLLANS